MQTYKKVMEASYLTAEKSWSYRAILRYFYIQHEKMREFLFPEEILAHMVTDLEWTDYTEEQLNQDLDQLVRWNNLIARQETGRARTIEEFKKKRFRYQCTAYTVEFERMLTAMEQDGETFGGSLEKKEFERLYETLYKLERILRENMMPTDENCAHIWKDVFQSFRSITKNTSDYIAHINSEEAEERMHTEAFLVFKDQFTTYLRDFIIELQQTALKIQHILQTITREKLQPFIQEVLNYEKKTPRFEFKEKSEAEVIQVELDKWQSLKVWFLGNEYGESELEMLEIRTNEQIRRITRIVQRLGERHHFTRSRKKDYLHLANWFENLDSIEEAHELSAVVFGLFHTKKVFSDHVPTENIYTSVWEERPILHRTTPRIRQYREKTRPGAIITQKEKQEEAKQAHLAQLALEKEMIATYMQNNVLDIQTLPTVPVFVRKMLLNWVGKAMSRKDRTFQTEHGHKVKMVLDDTKKNILRAEDGDMMMPSIIFHFQK